MVGITGLIFSFEELPNEEPECSKRAASLQAISILTTALGAMNLVTAFGAPKDIIV